MLNRLPYKIAFIFLILISTACAPSQARLDSHSTTVAALIYSTQTASALDTVTALIPSPSPSATPQPVPSSTPQPTPTVEPPLLPTQGTTPIPLKPGWVEHSAQEAHFGLPENWLGINASRSGMPAVHDAIEAADPEIAEAIQEYFDTDVFKAKLVYFGFDPMKVDSLVHLLLMRDTTDLEEVDQLCDFAVRLFKANDGTVTDSECGLMMNGLPAYRIELIHGTALNSVRQVHYTFLNRGVIWSMIFTCEERDWSRYRPIFAAIAATFHIQ